jgi:hypothetical protein
MATLTMNRPHAKTDRTSAAPGIVPTAAPAEVTAHELDRENESLQGSSQDDGSFFQGAVVLLVLEAMTVLVVAAIWLAFLHGHK